jgi:hypothetical protein
MTLGNAAIAKVRLLYRGQCQALMIACCSPLRSG